MNYILEGVHLKKRFSVGSVFSNFFKTGKKEIVAINDVSVEIEKGKVLVVAGESGSGKTTLAKILLRALDVDEGKIYFEGKDITYIKGKDLKKYRSNIQYVHQDPYSSLNPRLRIYDILMEPLEIHKKELSKGEKNEKIFKVLERVKLSQPESIAYNLPNTLSGGQRQRVSLSRALITEPKLIITDEPVSMLDISIRLEILELIKSFKKMGITFMYITHDLATSRIIGDDIIIMLSGKVVEKGKIDKVLFNPIHTYTKDLINAISEPKPENLFHNKNIIHEDNNT